MEPDKEHIYCSLFSKKVLLIHNYCETYDENIITILEHMQIDLNNLKILIFINDKELQTSCSSERGRIMEKGEKVMENDEKYFD